MILTVPLTKFYDIFDKPLMIKHMNRKVFELKKKGRFMQQRQSTISVDENHNQEFFFYDREDVSSELSNFYPRSIQIDGVYWPTLEHYYQAQRCSCPADKEKIRNAETTKKAQQILHGCCNGKNEAKVDTMRKALYAKFKQNEDLKQALLSTNQLIIKEKSNSNNYWSTGIDGKGENKMGELLMDVRDRIFKLEEAKKRARDQEVCTPIQKNVTVPTEYGKLNFNVYMDNRGREHLAIIAGTLSNTEPVMTRIHSECLTGDVFGSLKCDCGLQLENAMKAIKEEAKQGKCGILLYMKDEGRGIGLGNKLRAYKFQEEGFDTIEANEVLGLPIDAREYQFPASMLKDLGITSIRLITNNPDKINGLENQGIKVERQIIPSAINKFNEEYLKTKNSNMGHDIHSW